MICGERLRIGASEQRIKLSGWRRALELRAGSRDGCTEALMLALGFSITMMVELVRAGRARVKAERMVAGGKTIEVTRVRITAARRRAVDAGQKVRRPDG
jgi:hypothetical protein